MRAREKRKVVERVERMNSVRQSSARQNSSISNFYSYGRGTGGGSPMLPPPADGMEIYFFNFNPIKEKGHIHFLL